MYIVNGASCEILLNFLVVGEEVPYIPYFHGHVRKTIQTYLSDSLTTPHENVALPHGGMPC